MTSSTTAPPRPDHRNRVVLTSVSKSYPTDGGGEVQALSPIDLTIEAGEFVCVVGPSGCGKTTLLQMLAGFVEPTEGTIMIGGKHTYGPGPERGVVFQSPTLYPWLTVQGNVEFGLSMAGMGRKERTRRAAEALELVGLRGVGDRRPYELSGGMQQRAQIARVLVTDPRIILMDEPYGALDPFTREKLQLELLQLWSERRKTVVFITHDLDEAVFLSTRVLVMGAQPGRLLVDHKISLPGDTVVEHEAPSVRNPEVKTTPEFLEITRHLSGRIRDAHG